MFNNLFIQANGIPGLVFASGPDDIQVDGNLHWGLREGPKYQGDFFAQQSKGAAFRKQPVPDSWMTRDQFADPKLKQLSTDPAAPLDASLKGDSPAKDAGVEIPAEWFDPLRSADSGKPDVGALPLGKALEPAGRAAAEPTRVR